MFSVLSMVQFMTWSPVDCRMNKMHMAAMVYQYFDSMMKLIKEPKRITDQIMRRFR